MGNKTGRSGRIDSEIENLAAQFDTELSFGPPDSECDPIESRTRSGKAFKPSRVFPRRQEPSSNLLSGLPLDMEPNERKLRKNSLDAVGCDVAWAQGRKVLFPITATAKVSWAGESLSEPPIEARQGVTISCLAVKPRRRKRQGVGKVRKPLPRTRPSMS
ncbi:hypothetical protein NE237_022390 [Protea cynaroides]|uniref:Uncharacterized protein n=1 Tax=Protea cynaroides TaxID=273540 RepID=A0A9Q0H9I7_9MAGN|nr:hypothetical protein NE237_022390 [Protea cynaroides]